MQSALHVHARTRAHAGLGAPGRAGRGVYDSIHDDVIEKSQRARALATWHMLCISYDPTSPERFQKLKQSPEVSKRVGNSYSNSIFVATLVFI